MSNRQVTRLWIAALALLGFGRLCRVQALDLQPIPPLTAQVTDETGTLSDAEKSQLDGWLAQVEAQKGSQIAVLMVPTTQPEAIEQYSLRVAEAWKLGRKKVDDGILFLIAKNDHAMRFEVGYGLEGALPDAICERIINEIAAPKFHAGDYFGGIQDALQAVVKVVQGESLPAPEPHNAQRPGRFPLQSLLILALGGVFVSRMLFGRIFGGVIGGAAVGVAVWFLIGSLFLSLLLGVCALLFVLLGIGGGFGGGGFYGGFGGGGFGGGGFGGGGGFSGGGGSFGGGGASGSW